MEDHRGQKHPTKGLVELKDSSNVEVNIVFKCKSLQSSLTWLYILRNMTPYLQLQRRIWKRSIGNLSRWPPMSWRPHILSPLSSSSDLEVLPSSVVSVPGLNKGEEENIGRPPGPSWGGPSCWILGFDHLVHTKNEKHSAMLCIYKSENCISCCEKFDKEKIWASWKDYTKALPSTGAYIPWNCLCRM